MEKENIDMRYMRRKKIIGGLFFLLIGGILFAKQFGVIFPEWLLTWEMLLIVIGLFSGAKHGFRGYGWIIPILIGGLFLIDNFIPEFQISNYIWPSIIIFIGLMMIFGKHKPRHHRCKNKKWERYEKDYKAKYDNIYSMNENGNYNSDDMLDSVSIFGGVKRSIISKDFKGGEIVNVFGGTEINFMQADFTGNIKLEITQVFGGTKIIVPANWVIKSEINPIMGGYDDNRNLRTVIEDSDKVLILTGITVFGGIEINSY